MVFGASKNAARLDEHKGEPFTMKFGFTASNRWINRTHLVFFVASAILLVGMLVSCLHAQADQPGGDRLVKPSESQEGPSYTLSGIYSVGRGKRKSKRDLSYTSTANDVSAIYVHDGGSLVLSKPTIMKSGVSSSHSGSNFYGLNAGVLVTAGSKLDIHGGTVTSKGLGAAAVFAGGAGSKAMLSDLAIQASGADGGRGAMAVDGGTMTLNNVSIATSGEHSGAVATDRDGVTITINGGTLQTEGNFSPALYSTGAITASHVAMTAAASEAAVIKGTASIILLDSTLTARGGHGAMIYYEHANDGAGVKGYLVLHGGSFTATQGPLFYVTNSTGTIEAREVNLSAASGVLLKVSADKWGHYGMNGGHAILIAERQILPGDLTVGDRFSTIEATLKDGSTLTGSVHGAMLTLDTTSKWVVQGDSALVGLTEATETHATAIENIVGNGHTVTYKAGDARNSWLGGKTYPLTGGGQLIPEGGE
jgi:hypothetical protein